MSYSPELPLASPLTLRGGPPIEPPMRRKPTSRNDHYVYQYYNLSDCDDDNDNENLTQASTTGVPTAPTLEKNSCKREKRAVIAANESGVEATNLFILKGPEDVGIINLNSYLNSDLNEMRNVRGGSECHGGYECHLMMRSVVNMSKSAPMRWDLANVGTRLGTRGKR